MLLSSDATEMCHPHPITLDGHQSETGSKYEFGQNTERSLKKMWRQP